jgi:hypothetical protein
VEVRVLFGAFESPALAGLSQFRAVLADRQGTTFAATTVPQCRCRGAASALQRVSSNQQPMLAMVSESARASFPAAQNVLDGPAK